MLKHVAEDTGDFISILPGFNVSNSGNKRFGHEGNVPYFNHFKVDTVPLGQIEGEFSHSVPGQEQVSRGLRDNKNRISITLSENSIICKKGVKVKFRGDKRLDKDNTSCYIYTILHKGV